MPESGFQTDLMVAETPEHRWRLTSDLVYQGNVERFVVPSGFETDFASVPQLFLWLVPRSGRYTRAAVLHDWLTRDRPDISRCDADGIFRRTMRELGVSIVRRWMMWTAVRWAKPGRVGDCGPVGLLATLAISAGLLVPALVVGLPTFLLLLAVYLVEWAAYAVVRARGRQSPRPTFVWWSEPSRRRIPLIDD